MSTSRFHLGLIGLLVTSWLSAQSPAQPATAKDTAVLELQLPEGARLEIDGKDIGSPQQYVYRDLEPGRMYQKEITVRFNDGKETKRTLLVRSGEVIRLALPRPDTTRPELVLQTGHTNRVKAVAFSPDGKQVLTGSEDQTAILWDAASGRKLRSFQGHTGKVSSVAFSPDGKQVLTGSWDNKAILWDAASGQKLRTFQMRFDWILSVVFSLDGKQILTGTSDNTAVLWDAASGQELLAFQGHSEDVKAVAFSPDGKQVLTGSDDKTAVLWDATSGQKLHAFQGHTERVLAVAFSPDGKHVLTGSFDKTAVLWDAASGQKIHEFREPSETLFPLAFSPDGKQVLTGSFDKIVVLWDATNGKKIRDFQDTRAFQVAAFSPDGKQILTGSDDNMVVLWDAASGKKIHEFQGYSSSVDRVVVSSDGHRILSDSHFQAVLWNMSNGQKLRAFQWGEFGINAVKFSSDSKQILTGEIIRADLWDADSGKKLRSFEGQEGIEAVAFSPDGRQVLTGSWDKTVMLWDKDSGKQLRTFPVHKERVMAVAFSPDGKQVLTSAWDKTVMLWDKASGKKLLTIEEDISGNQAVAFSPDGTQILIGTPDIKAVLYDSASGKKLRTFQGQSRSDMIRAVAFSPDGKQILTGSLYREVVLWDPASGQKLRDFLGHTDRVTAVAFSPNGRRIVTASYDGTTRIWDIATGDELCRLISIDRGQDWVVLTPEGLFDGSKTGREKSFFRIGQTNDIVPMDRFFQDFYYPGLLAAIWRGERPMPGKPFQTNPPPLVKMLVQSPDAVKKNQIAIDVAVTDQGGGIKGPWLQHNGASLKSGQLLKKDDKTAHHRFEVSLVGGANRIEVRAATADGAVESEPASTTIPFDGKLPEPELHVLIVGINRFTKGAGVGDLDFCVPDAKAMADMFQKRSGKLFKTAHVTQLLDDQATKDGILKAVAIISTKARPQDTLVLYVASHGITVGQRFYMIPHDFKLGKEEPKTEKPKTEVSAMTMRGYGSASDEREAAVRQHGLAIDELGEVLASVPALKRVLIFDTCHSGSAISLAGKKQNPFAFRGAMERFSRAQGVYSLSATAADELAAETKDLGHSILTYALLAGAGAADKGPLAGKRMKSDKNAIDVLDWFRFARGEVPGLYEKYVGRPQSVELSGEDQPGFRLLNAGTGRMGE